MKKWIEKFMGQFDMDSTNTALTDVISEDRATLLFLIDSYCKHLIELDSTSPRKVREIFDEFVKELIQVHPERDEKTLFRFRQYFTSYRIEEYTYVQKTFDDFRGIIWDVVDQLSEDFKHEKIEHQAMSLNIENLKEAVESNSIGLLKTNARQFVDNYIEYQTTRDRRRTERMDKVRKNLDNVKQKLVDATDSLNTDHLTKAQNRRSFETHGKNMVNLAVMNQKPMALVMFDIDHFKKVNDTYGHAIGDFLLQECVKILQDVFSKPTDFVARVGGEEFALLLSECNLEQASFRCEKALARIRTEAFVQDKFTLRFTASMGICVFNPESQNETLDSLMKKADEALYQAKGSGRNRFVVFKQAA
jgi:diguanylate cyclase